MTHILTFVSADPKTSPLQISEILGLGFGTEYVSQEPYKAADIYISAPLSLREMKSLRGALFSRRIDVFCVPQAGRQKKLLLADMDSTIVVEETLDDLAAFAGVKPEVEKITARAMNGELDFHSAIRERVRLLKGLAEGALGETLSAIQIMPGAEKLVSRMSEVGALCVLVTGGFTYFADEIAKEVGFDKVHANVLGVEGGHLTGEVIPPILDKDAKLSFLKEYAHRQAIELSETMAIGDGANDLPMLEAAGLGIGYHPKPVLEERLLNIIRHGDLSTALYAQGIAVR